MFANIYLNELDQFVKHELKVKYYARYTDDFIIISHDPAYLALVLGPVCLFLESALTLTLHPNKVSIRKYRQGSDFLGYVNLPHYRVLRTKTKQRMLRKLARRAAAYEAGAIEKEAFVATLRSYLGVLTHANAHRLREQILNQYGSVLMKNKE